MADNGMFDAEANATLDARLPNPCTVDLYTTMPTSAGGVASGTKVTGGGYAQGSAPMANAAASRQKANSGPLTFSNLPDTNGLGGVKGIDLNGRWKMPFASARITNGGDSMVFATGSIVAGYVNGT